MTLIEQIEKLLAQQFPALERLTITEGTHLESDLGADSLDHLEVVLAVEEDFAVEINDDEAERLVTVGDIVQLLTEKGK